jgi:hypothetical protein
MATVVVSPVLTVAVVLPLPISVGVVSELYALTVIVQLPKAREATVVDVPVMVCVKVALLGPVPLIV